MSLVEQELKDGSKGQEGDSFSWPFGTLLLKREDYNKRGAARQTSDFFYLPEVVTDDSILQATELAVKSGISPALPLIRRPRGWRIDVEFHTGEEEVSISVHNVEVERGRQQTVFNDVWYSINGGVVAQMEHRKLGSVGLIGEAKEIAFVPIAAIRGKRKTGGVLIISVGGWAHFDPSNERHRKRIENFLK